MLNIGCSRLPCEFMYSAISPTSPGGLSNSFGKDFFSAQISSQTLSVTTLYDLKKGDKVNLERALTLSQRLGGHIVTGHVDCKAKVLNIEKMSEFYNLKLILWLINTKN